MAYEDWLGSVVSGVSGERREVLKTISRRYVIFSGRTEDQMRLLGPEAAHGYILGFFFMKCCVGLCMDIVSVCPSVTYFSAEICPSAT